MQCIYIYCENILWKREHWLKIMTITQCDSWMGLTCIYCLNLGFRVTTSCMAAGMKLVFSCFKEMLLVTNLHVPRVATLLHNFTPCASAQYKKLLYLSLCVYVCVSEFGILLHLCFLYFVGWCEISMNHRTSICTASQVSLKNRIELIIIKKRILEFRELKKKHYYFLKCCLFSAIIFNEQLDKTSPVHTRRCVSGDMGGKVLLPWNLTCQFTCSLPPTISEASQTQMFYTAYEMFEGHRKRKWAWFPLCWAPWMKPTLHLCAVHALIFLSMDAYILVAW